MGLATGISPGPFRRTQAPADNEANLRPTTRADAHTRGRQFAGRFGGICAPVGSPLRWFLHPVTLSQARPAGRRTGAAIRLHSAHRFHRQPSASQPRRLGPMLASRGPVAATAGRLFLRLGSPSSAVARLPTLQSVILVLAAIPAERQVSCLYVSRLGSDWKP